MQKAFSLIELVIAIVVIAISVMTIPLMLNQSMRNDSLSMMQESILAARTNMENILTYPWDDNSVEADSTILRVLDVQNGDGDLNRTDGTATQKNRRVGHILADKRRRFHDSNDSLALADLTFPTIDGNKADKSAINHFDTEVTSTTASAGNSAFDYKFLDLNITSTIRYINDDANYTKQTIDDFDFTTSGTDITNLANSTNIKMIEILVESEYIIPFRLRAYSCNIGQTDLLYRDTGIIP